MSRGREVRLTAIVLAGNLLASALAGCQSPFARLADRSSSRPSSGSSPGVTPQDMPKLEPVPESWTQATRTAVSSRGMDRELPLAPVAAAPTPLLDAALKHAEAIEQTRRETAPAADPPAVAGPSPSTPVVPVVAAVSHTSTKDEKEPARSTGGPAEKSGAPAPQVRAQVVEWLASEVAKPENRALVQQAANTIAAAIKSSAKQQSRQSSDAGSEAVALAEKTALGVSELRLCRKVNGFGSFEPLPSSSLKLGQPFLIYCELNGLRYQPRDAHFVSRMSSRVELIAPRDGKAVWEQSLGEAQDECGSQRRDNYVNYRIAIPQTIPAGEYRLRLTQTDLLANHSASSELTVTLVQ